MTWTVLGVGLCILMLPVVAIAALAPEGWPMVLTTGALVLMQLSALSCFVRDDRGTESGDPPGDGDGIGQATP